MKANVFQVLVCALLIILAVLILNPAHLWMPDMLHMTVLALLLVLFAIYAGFIVREQVRDERDTWIRMLSGRIGYLTGAAVLVVAIAVQGISGTPDPWLVLALLGMLLAKLGTHFYIDSI